MNSIEILDTPDKSENDKKLYRMVRLENGLEALLVSDPVLISKKTEELVIKNSDEITSATVGNRNESEEVKTGTDIGDVEENQEREKLASCCVCVNVGSFSDPRDVQGLSHFLGKSLQICR